MSKIYNEIVIDMNPESPDFEKVIYEDSYEYRGDTILMQGGHEGEIALLDLGAHTVVDGQYQPYQYTDGEWVMVKGGSRTNDPDTDYPDATVFTSKSELENQYSSDEENIWSGGKDIGDIDLTGLTEEEAIDKIAELKYGWKPTGGTADQDWHIPWGDIKAELYQTGWSLFDEGGESLGLPAMSYKEWNEKSDDEKADFVLKYKYGNDPSRIEDFTEGSGMDAREWIKQNILADMPMKEEVDPTEVDYLETKFGSRQVDSSIVEAIKNIIFSGDSTVTPENAHLDYNNSGVIDVGDIEASVGEGTFAQSLAGQTAEGALTGAGLVYEGAGTTYTGAGLTYGAAGEAYKAAGRTFEGAGLAYEGAETQKETMLSNLQEQAYTLGGDFSPASSTGVGGRTKRRQQDILKKGFETGMDVYDLAGEKYGLAEEAYRGAGVSYGAAGENVTDPGPDGILGDNPDTEVDESADDIVSEDLGIYGLAGQRYDLAEDVYEGAGTAYNLARDKAYSSFDIGMYGLESGVEADWMSDWQSWWNTI